MKINKLDERLLALEAKANYGLNIYEEEERNQFIIKRQEKKKKSKDKRKSMDQKHSFRRNKQKFMKGIKRFHKSAEGKRFHRKLGNFVAKTAKSNGVVESYDSSIIVALLSLKSHLNIHESYLCPIVEGNSSWEILFEEANAVLTSVIGKYEDNIRLSENELEMVFNLLIPERIESIDSSLVEDNKLFKTIYERSAFVNNYLEAIEEVFVDGQIFPLQARQLLATLNLTPIELGSFALSKRSNFKRITEVLMQSNVWNPHLYEGLIFNTVGDLTRVQVIPAVKANVQEAKNGIPDLQKYLGRLKK